MSKQRSTLLPFIATMSNEFYNVETNWTHSICFDFEIPLHRTGGLLSTGPSFCTHPMYMQNMNCRIFHEVIEIYCCVYFLAFCTPMACKGVWCADVNIFFSFWGDFVHSPTTGTLPLDLSWGFRFPVKMYHLQHRRDFLLNYFTHLLYVGHRIDKAVFSTFKDFY